MTERTAAELRYEETDQRLARTCRQLERDVGRLRREFVICPQEVSLAQIEIANLTVSRPQVAEQCLGRLRDVPLFVAHSERWHDFNIGDRRNTGAASES